ncbi:hypothetical protein DXG01_009977 [Tephrocybe rancida]|nr:hypothetical protein DXG01_009977 [Tephrocybe rancida]
MFHKSPCPPFDPLPAKLDAERWVFTSLSPPPFPRYGHAIPAAVTESGDIYIFGGLAGQTVRNDLYLLSPKITQQRWSKQAAKFRVLAWGMGVVKCVKYSLYGVETRREASNHIMRHGTTQSIS